MPHPVDPFLAEFEPRVAALARKTLARVRALAPGATEPQAIVKAIYARRRPRRLGGRAAR